MNGTQVCLHKLKSRQMPTLHYVAGIQYSIEGRIGPPCSKGAPSSWADASLQGGRRVGTPFPHLSSAAPHQANRYRQNTGLGSRSFAVIALGAKPAQMVQTQRGALAESSPPLQWRVSVGAANHTGIPGD